MYTEESPAGECYPSNTCLSLVRKWGRGRGSERGSERKKWGGGGEGRGADIITTRVGYRVGAGNKVHGGISCRRASATPSTCLSLMRKGGRGRGSERKKKEKKKKKKKGEGGFITTRVGYKGMAGNKVHGGNLLQENVTPSTCLSLVRKGGGGDQRDKGGWELGGGDWRSEREGEAS